MLDWREKLAKNIIRSLQERKGFSNWWYNCDEEDREDIIRDIVGEIQDIETTIYDELGV